MSRAGSEEGEAGWSGPLPDRRGLGVASKTLRVMSNPVRLEILCHLLKREELGVGELVEAVGLSQSALSQHLGKLRALGMVATRRDQQRIYYRIAREDVQQVMDLLRELYCEGEVGKKGKILNGAKVGAS